MKKQVAEQKRLKEEKEQEQLKQRAAIFKRLPGKILKGVAVFSFVFSLLLFVDNFLPTSYHKHEIHSAIEERYDIISHDGWHVICTYMHVCLKDDCSYDYFIHEKEYLKAKPLGYIEVEKTPIFHINKGFRVGKGDTLAQKRVYLHLYAHIALPIFLMILSLFWILLKPEKNAQIITFGYILMITFPFLLFFMFKHTYAYRFDHGIYEMNLNDIELDQEIEEAE